MELASSSAEERVKNEIEARCQEMSKKLEEKTANEEWMRGKWDQQSRRIHALEAEKADLMEQVRMLKDEAEEEGRRGVRKEVKGRGRNERNLERSSALRPGSQSLTPLVRRSNDAGSVSGITSSSGASTNNGAPQSSDKLRRVSFQSPPSLLKRGILKRGHVQWKEECSEVDDVDDDDFMPLKNRVNFGRNVATREPDGGTVRRSERDAMRDEASELDHGSESQHSGAIARIDGGIKRVSAARTPLSFA